MWSTQPVERELITLRAKKKHFQNQGCNVESELQLCILCVHIEISSLWAEFVNKNRCSGRLVTEEDKSI